MSLVAHQAAVIALAAPEGLVFEERPNIPNVICPGKIGFFGGGQEPEDGNSAFATIVRELGQETSLIPETLDIIPVGRRWLMGRTPQTTRGLIGINVFAARIPSNEFEVFEGSKALTIPKTAFEGRRPARPDNLIQIVFWATKDIVKKGIL